MLNPEQIREAIREVVCPMSDSKPKPAVVCQRKKGKLDLNTGAVFDSTNAAFAAAERWAKSCAGEEYVVLQEKGSKRVEKSTPEQKLLRHFMEDLRSGEASDFRDENEVVQAVARTISVNLRDDGKIEVLYQPVS